LGIIAKPESERNALACDIDLKDFHRDYFSRTNHFVWVRNILIAHCCDMHQAILMHTHIDKRAKGRHVSNCAFQDHSWNKVRDFLNAFLKRSCLKLWPRVTPWLVQLSDDVRDRWNTESIISKISGAKGI